MKVFLAGAVGRLGRAVVTEAGRRGDEVVGLDITGWPEDAGPQPNHLRLVEGSFEDRDLLAQCLAGCDVAIHVTGPHNVQRHTMALSEYCRITVTGVVQMLETAQAVGCSRAVVSSTIQIFIGVDDAISPIGWYDEDTTPFTGDKYALSRHLMEQAVRFYARQQNFPVSMLRYLAFGDPSRPPGHRLLGIECSPLDAARAVMLAAERDDLFGEVFHIGAGGPLTISDTDRAVHDPAGVLEKHYPGSVAVLQREGVKIEPNLCRRFSGIDKARRVLGYEPEHTFERWLRSKGWNPPPDDAGVRPE